MSKKLPTYQGNATSFKMHVKKGDTVQIISGSYKGKVAKILAVFPKTSTVLVEGVNLKTKHVKPQGESQPGEIVTREFPIHSSKVMVYSDKEKLASRIGYTVTEAGKKVRTLKRTNEILS
ncbi:ribosomal protein L24, bacterial/organelle [Synechococcus sp. PCC 7502]|uniref:50S ribosomal protein L24 n=1 Tax=Synechococcus sp. PCC 7502 TaxID=1173263 RepID=UPI00029FAC11|nr:50S ribosomal protein L24 [Synechococcus sp. PCC 7502]AFY72910.1 ribosomal protein L24, bacterial/organelle [Synechococcus sp. PCC 7502]